MAAEINISEITGFDAEQAFIGGARPRHELRLTVQTMDGEVHLTFEPPHYLKRTDPEDLIVKLAEAIEQARKEVAA